MGNERKQPTQQPRRAESETMRKAREAYEYVSDRSALEAANAEAAAALAFSAGLTPNGLALARGANNRAYEQGRGLATADPRVQAMIRELSGQQDAQEAAGQMAPSPLLAGDMAGVMGRMPIMGSANWGTGALTPDQEERLVSMGQPLDPAGSFGSPAEAAKWARLAMIPQAAPSAPANPVIDGNEGAGPVNMDRVAELQALKQSQAAAKQRAAGNVGLMSMAGGLARKQALGIIPQGVDVNDLLSAMNPDAQAILTPEAVALQKQAENAAADIAMRGTVADTAAKSAAEVANIDASVRRANIDAVAKSEAARLEVEKQRIATQDKIAEIERERQAARDARDKATSDSQVKLAEMQIKKAEIDMESEKKKQAEWDSLAEIRRKEAEKASKKLSRDNYTEYDDPFERADAMVADLQEAMSGQNLNGKTFETLPVSVRNFLQHVSQNRDKFVRSSYFQTDETDFEDYIVQRLSGIGGITPVTARRIAEEFFEAQN